MAVKVEITPTGTKIYSMEVPESLTKEQVEKHIKELQKKYMKKRK